MNALGSVVVLAGVAAMALGFMAAPAEPLTEPDTDRSIPAAGPGSFRMSGNQILVERFEIKHELRGNELTLALETDLGDSAKVEVTISRYYKPPGHHNAYPVNYFTGSGTVGAWRNPHTVELDNDAWWGELAKRRQILADLERPITDTFISDDIEIRFMVPLGQSPPFEPRNANLTGTVVMVEPNYRVVTRRVKTRFPLDTNSGGPDL